MAEGLGAIGGGIAEGVAVDAGEAIGTATVGKVCSGLKADEDIGAAGDADGLAGGLKEVTETQRDVEVDLVFLQVAADGAGVAAAMARVDDDVERVSRRRKGHQARPEDGTHARTHSRREPSRCCSSAHGAGGKVVAGKWGRRAASHEGEPTSLPLRRLRRSADAGASHWAVS